MLCCVFACEGRALVMGGKDKNLRVYEVSSGKLLYVLPGHQANVCSLASHGQLVSSGGDHGCSSLIVWDSGKSWAMRSRVQLHTAAVTCIVDLQDSTALATGSYDRKLNIFSHRKGTVVLTATCKAGIACMALSSDKHRLISSALDNSIVIWKLSREVPPHALRAPTSPT
jgi:WD40 repeat protein